MITNYPTPNQSERQRPESGPRAHMLSRLQTIAVGKELARQGFISTPADNEVPPYFQPRHLQMAETALNPALTMSQDVVDHQAKRIEELQFNDNAATAQRPANLALAMSQQEIDNTFDQMTQTTILDSEVNPILKQALEDIELSARPARETLDDLQKTSI